MHWIGRGESRYALAVGGRADTLVTRQALAVGGRADTLVCPYEEGGLPVAVRAVTHRLPGSGQTSVSALSEANALVRLHGAITPPFDAFIRRR